MCVCVCVCVCAIHEPNNKHLFAVPLPQSTLYYIPGLASEEELSKAEHHYLETMKGSMLPRVKVRL